MLKGEEEQLASEGQPAVDAETGEAPVAPLAEGEEAPSEPPLEQGGEAEGAAPRLSKTSKKVSLEVEKDKTVKDVSEESPGKKLVKEEKKASKDIQDDEKKPKAEKPTKEKESPKKKKEEPESPKKKGKKGKEIKKKESIPPPEPSLELSMSVSCIEEKFLCLRVNELSSYNLNTTTYKNFFCCTI